MRFTWKGPSTRSAYPSNTAPNLLAPGPYPSKGNTIPTTVTKLVLETIPRSYTLSEVTYTNSGTSYYDPVAKSVRFVTQTCTSVGTSLPTVCNKKLSRPLKVWRKRLTKDGKKTKVTLNQLQGTSVTTTKEEGNCVHSDIFHLKDCSPPICKKVPSHLKSRGTYRQEFCATTREYLQKRTKTFDQNQLQGKKIADYTFTSGEGSESTDVTGICNKITIKPSNPTFHEQGGVTASSRTNRLKYDTVMSNVHMANYATARSTIDTGYLQVKSQNKPKSMGYVFARHDRPKVAFCDKVLDKG